MNDDFYDLDFIQDYFEMDPGPSSDNFNLDKSLEEDYPPGSLEYRKARKRRQNRESAARSRARKKITISQVSDEITILEDLSEKLTIENSTLKAENDMLKKELEFYKSMILQ